MKRITAILAAFMLLLTLSVTESNAQGSLLLSGGLSLSNDNLGQNLEIGTELGKNSLTAVVSTSDVSGSERAWYAGAKYYRNKTVSPTLSAFATAGLFVGLRDVQDLVFKPGVGLNLKLSRNFYLQGSLTTPIRENTALFRPVGLEALTQLVLRFDQ